MLSNEFIRRLNEHPYCEPWVRGKRHCIADCKLREKQLPSSLVVYTENRTIRRFHPFLTQSNLFQNSA